MANNPYQSEESFRLIGMQRPEKYKENFDIPSEGPLSPGTFQVIGSLPIENRSGFYTFVTW
jgi:hypothetical protein